MTTAEPATGRILIVDDDAGVCLLLASALGKRGHEVTWKTSATDALEVLAADDVDSVLADVDMPGMSGIELCERVAANRPDVPVTILTGLDNLATAVAAIRAGAYDFLTKPPEPDTVALAVERAIQHRRLREEVRRLRREIEESRPSGGMVGTSRPMQHLAGVLDRMADSDATVLITGESGTGKELVARQLHERGRRRAGAFVAINCAALPETLLESELFGHMRGAFTDARADRSGLFAQANGGTLFLDEIGELPLALQPKLLRALQERTIRPLGGSTEIAVDVRVIAATNRDLEAAVQEGRFRSDLFFRINVLRVDVPSLRARGSDVLLLAQHFIERHAQRSQKPVIGLTPGAAERLMAHSWPGNVRELENCIEHAVALARMERIGVDDLPASARGPRRATRVSREEENELIPLEEIERRHILRVLDAVKGNRTLASRALGVDRKTLYRKLERYGVRE